MGRHTPFVTTSLGHHFPSSPHSLRHRLPKPPLPPPFVMYCSVMSQFYLPVTRKIASQLPLINKSSGILRDQSFDSKADAISQFTTIFFKRRSQFVWNVRRHMAWNLQRPQNGIWMGLKLMGSYGYLMDHHTTNYGDFYWFAQLPVHEVITHIDRQK